PADPGNARRARRRAWRAQGARGRAGEDPGPATTAHCDEGQRAGSGAREPGDRNGQPGSGASPGRRPGAVALDACRVGRGVAGCVVVRAPQWTQAAPAPVRFGGDGRQRAFQDGTGARARADGACGARATCSTGAGTTSSGTTSSGTTSSGTTS